MGAPCSKFTLSQQVASLDPGLSLWPLQDWAGLSLPVTRAMRWVFCFLSMLPSIVLPPSLLSLLFLPPFCTCHVLSSNLQSPACGPLGKSPGTDWAPYTDQTVGNWLGVSRAQTMGSWIQMRATAATFLTGHLSSGQSYEVHLQLPMMLLPSSDSVHNCHVTQSSSSGRQPQSGQMASKALATTALLRLCGNEGL